MKNLFVCFVFIPVMALSCFAATVYQPFDDGAIPIGWTQKIDSNNSTLAYSPGFCNTYIYRDTGDSNGTSLGVSLGSAAIAAGADVNTMPEDIWMSVDITFIGGSTGTSKTVYVGLFNPNFDSDFSPSNNVLGVACGGGKFSQAQPFSVAVSGIKGAGDTSGSVFEGDTINPANTADSDTYRLSMHFYRSGASYLGDLTITDITNSNIPAVSITGVTVLSSGEKFNVGMGSFGIRNVIGLHNYAYTYKLDNMYYSTEQSFTPPLPPLKMIAQPESRELFLAGESLPTSVVEDANYSNLTYTGPVLGLSSNVQAGALVLAFRLPEIPTGKVLSKAILKWYYSNYYTGRIRQTDLYALTPYRDGTTDPGITPCYYEEDCGDYYVGPYTDTTDAELIKSNIAPLSILDPGVTGYIKRWINTDPADYTLVHILREQYADGANANDWFLLRFNTTTIDTSKVRTNIFGPCHINVDMRPYIEYELADADYGYFDNVVLVSPRSVYHDGNFPGRTTNIGCYDTNNGFENAELIVPFQFPVLGSGQYIAEVTLTATTGGRSNTGDFNTDIYGLPYRSSTSFASTDFWTGPYAPQAGDAPTINGTPIQADVFSGVASGTTAQSWLLDAEGGLRAACYLEAQRTAGATVNDYGFLRFGTRYDNFNCFARQTISTFAMGVRISTVAPVYPGVPATQGGCPIYSDDTLEADSNGDCVVNFEDFVAVGENWLECNALPAELYCQ